MREPVGPCVLCKKEVYCHDGFLNGMVLDSGHLLCFSCRDAHDQSD
jgi:hypothetical protein